MSEIWLPIPSIEGALASDDGRIKLPSFYGTMPNGAPRLYDPKPTFGYLTKASKNSEHQKLTIKSKRFGTLIVSRLVCEAFHGKAPPDKPEARHLDGDSLNNCADNLRWSTRKEILNGEKFVNYRKSCTGENSSAVKGEIARQERRQALMKRLQGI